MEKKQLLIYIPVVIIAIIASFILGGYFGLKGSKIVRPVESRKDDKIYIYNVSNNEGTKYANVNLKYPAVNGLDDLNKSISDYINTSLSDFNTNSEENWKARVETAVFGENVPEFPPNDNKFIITSNWELAQLNDDYVSILIKIYDFSGGAHGATTLKSFNYNLKEHKIVALSDMFPKDQDFLKKVSDYAISDLTQRFADTGMTIVDSIKEGAGPKLENFSIFTISEGKITFYFPQYSIGPYSFGIQSVDMYLNQ